MRLIVFLLVFILSFTPVYGKETYFDYSGVNQLNSLGVTEFAIHYEIKGGSESQFRFIPRTEGNIPMQVYIDNKPVTIKSWEGAPALSKTIKIRFLNTGFYSTKLWFQIQDIETAQIYETPKKSIRSRKWFFEYLSLIKYSNEDY